MSKLTDYQKPEVQEYSWFESVVEGASPAAPGEERSDVNTCNVGGLDEEA